MTEAAQTALDEFATRLAAKGEARSAPGPELCSDILPVLLLPRVANYIVSSSGVAVSDGVGPSFGGLPPVFKNFPKVESEASANAPLA